MEQQICRGMSYTDIAYTIREDQICRGMSYTDIAYTIREDQICRDMSYTDVAYTIRGDQICRGMSYTDIAYTIRGDQICRGMSYTDVAYTIRPGSPGGAGDYSDKSKREPWNLKKTICLLITLALQAVLIFFLVSGEVAVAVEESLVSFIVVNAIMLGNSLVSGILCLIARYKIGSILSMLVNATFGIYIFVTAMGFMDGFIYTVLGILFFSLIESGVVHVGYKLSNLFCRK